MQPQSAAKQLGELAKAGLVQKTSRGRESFYELSDPLMRICIEVRDNRAGYIGAFVDLLRHWFSSRELESSHHPLYEEALASAEQGQRRRRGRYRRATIGAGGHRAVEVLADDVQLYPARRARHRREARTGQR